MLLMIMGGNTARGDPGSAEVLWTFYLGGSDVDEAVGIGLDAAGNALIGGMTDSADFPVHIGQENPFWEQYLTRDGFVTWLSPDGSLLRSTYAAWPYIDADEEVCAFTVGPRGGYLAGLFDAGGDVLPFFAWVGPENGEPMFSHVSSPNYGERISGIAADSTGEPRVVWASDYDLQAGVFRTSRDVWVSNGSLWPIFGLGGSGDEDPVGLAVDSTGDLYVIGNTTSADFPFGAPVPEGGGFLAKLDGSSGGLLFALPFGDSTPEAVVVDAADQVWVTGRTCDPSFPLRNPVQPALAGSCDAYVMTLGPGGEIVFSTFLGGGAYDRGTAIAVDGLGRVAVVGTTWSPDFPLVDPVLSARQEIFATVLDPRRGRIDFSTRFGGSGDDRPAGVALGPAGDLWIGGTTTSADLPAGRGFRGGGPSDAFITRISTNRPPDCSGATALPGVVWPPNRSFVPVSIAGVDDPDGDPVSIVVTGIRQDEPVSGPGDVGPDATGIGTPAARVRAERAGNGDGRVYHLAYEARDARGVACTSEVTVCVSHDGHGSAGCKDGGALFDSGTR